ncbi:MAG: Apolipoprotein N-acyltransferase, partial [Pseudonocardiales bacterium]|nr:Apolipoprotein N-acyltransferase [Pseudonocardiales bacterium]
PVVAAAVVAILGGVAGVLAFPRPGLWWLAPVSIAALSVAVAGQGLRRSAWLGFLWGAAFFLPLLHWTSTFVGAAPWLILALAEAGYIALLAPLLTLVQRLPFWPAWAGAAWVAQEALRGRAPFGGFPWGRWAFSQSTAPTRWFAALAGAPGVTFVVALAGALIAAAILRGLGAPRPNRRVPVGVVGGLLAGALGLMAAGWGLGPLLRPDAGGPSITIALVQGSVPDRGLEFNERRSQVLANHVNETLELARRIEAGELARPDLVLWPENASDIDPYEDPEAAAAITSAVEAVGVPILVGAILDGPGDDHVTNVGILWSPATGPGEQYAKRHPVPFGEYIPLRSIARKISKDVDLVRRDMVAGEGDGRIDGAAVPLGDVICFEVAYDSLVRSSVEAGAQLLVVQTNNATFGHSAETYQQLAMSRLRAVEHGRAVAQVATSGKSAIIAPDGSVQAESAQLFSPALLVEQVQTRTSLTLATRVGAWPEWVLTAAALLAGAAAALAARRQRAAPIPDTATTRTDTASDTATEETTA